MTLEKETNKDGIAIVKVGWNHNVNDNASAVSCKRLAKMIAIASVEVCSMSNIVFVHIKRKCDVQDDTQSITFGEGKIIEFSTSNLV